MSQSPMSDEPPRSRYVRGGSVFSAIKDLLKKNPQGMTVTEIAAELSKNKHSVGRYLDNLKASGAVEMRTFGMAKVFSLARRVPISRIFGTSSELIMALDAEHRIVQVNDRFLELLQLSREKVVGRSPEFLPIPDPAVQEMMTDLMEPSAPNSQLREIRLDRGNGRHFGVRILATRFDDDSPGTIIVMADITDHIRALKDIKDREEMFRGMAENIQDGLIVCEEDRILFANRKVSEILGYSPDEIVGMKAGDFLPPGERKKILAIMKNPGDLEACSVIRARVMRKEGDERFIEARLSSMKYDDRIRRFILITDMTEWKERFNAITRKSAFMETLFDAYPRPIFFLNPDGKLEGCNTAFIAMAKVGRRELVGKEPYEVLDPDLSASLMAGEIDLSTTLGRTMSRLTINDPGGETREYLLEKVSFHAGDSQKNWVFGIFIDSKACMSCFSP